MVAQAIRIRDNHIYEDIIMTTTAYDGTSERRLQRIQQLEIELAELRQKAAVLEEELDALQCAETPADRAHLARKWWDALRVGGIITLDEFEQLLDECREAKTKSPSAACITFRNRLELTMADAVKYIRML
jgi:hypothetical protein